MKIAAASFVALLFFCTTASAGDPNAVFLIQLFNNVCVPNMGRSDAVRAWASKQHLPPITRPYALNAFVGPSNQERGAAWDVPSPTDKHFALSIRSVTQACAVYAQQADQATIEKMFITELNGVARPGLEVKKLGEEKRKTQLGLAKMITYLVTTSEPVGKGFEFILTTSEHPGAAFQASIQLAGVLLGE